jgi:hypothetical protein
MSFFNTSDLQQKTSLQAFTPVRKTNKLLVILNIFRTKWLIQFQTWVLPKFTINQNLKILQITNQQVVVVMLNTKGITYWNCFSRVYEAIKTY